MRWHYWTTLAPTVTILFGSCRHETHRLLLVSYTNKVDCLQRRNSGEWPLACASSYLLIELLVVERLLQLHALALLFFKSAHAQAAGVRLVDFLCRPHNILPTEHRSLNLQITHTGPLPCAFSDILCVRPILFPKYRMLMRVQSYPLSAQ